MRRQCVSVGITQPIFPPLTVTVHRASLQFTELASQWGLRPRDGVESDLPASGKYSPLPPLPLLFIVEVSLPNLDSGAGKPQKISSRLAGPANTAIGSGGRLALKVGVLGLDSGLSWTWFMTQSQSVTHLVLT